MNSERRIRESFGAPGPIHVKLFAYNCDQTRCQYCEEIPVTLFVIEDFSVCVSHSIQKRS